MRDSLMKLSKMAAIVLLTLGANGCATTSGPSAEELASADYGVTPSEAQFYASSEAAIRNSLVDPDSARFDWPYEVVQGHWQEPYYYGEGYFGFYTCGWVNARNRMGGYAGRAPFVVVYNDNRIIHSEIADTTYGNLAVACRNTNWQQNFEWQAE